MGWNFWVWICGLGFWIYGLAIMGLHSWLRIWIYGLGIMSWDLDLCDDIYGLGFGTYQFESADPAWTEGWKLQRSEHGLEKKWIYSTRRT